MSQGETINKSFRRDLIPKLELQGVFPTCTEQEMKIIRLKIAKGPKIKAKTDNVFD